MQMVFPSISRLHKEVSVVPHWVHSGLLGVPGIAIGRVGYTGVTDCVLIGHIIGIVLVFSKLLFEGVWALIEFLLSCDTEELEDPNDCISSDVFGAGKR